MSPQDAQMLNDFLGQLVQARGVQKDAEADALIQRALAQQPDAGYLLVQRSLLQQQALDQARDQIARLQAQRQSQAGGQDARRFPDANAWGNSGGTRPADDPRDPGQERYPSANRQPDPQPYPQPYQQQAAPGGMFGGRGGGFLGGAGGSFLGSVAATAAGVAAGSFLFHGLDNMFHHHDQGGNRLLNSDDQGSNLFSDQSGSALAGQAGLGDIGGASGNRLLDSGPGEPAVEGLFDSAADERDSGTLDSTGGFFDGDGSDEGLFG